MKLIFFVVLLALGAVNSQRSAGDSCEIPGIGPGKCTSLWRCQSAKEGLRKGIRPTNCGFDLNDPIVCCANEPGNKAIEKCTQYADLTKHLKVYSVVGGTDATQKEFPHMAALGFGALNNIQWQCGGSLISENFVLTAAHCLQGSGLGDVQFVRLGDIHLDGSSQTNQDFKVKRRIAHPSFQPPSLYHDIGLVELDKSVNYTVYVKPACLHIQENVNPELMWSFVATGWGLTEFGGSSSDILQKVGLELFSKEECDKVYKQSNRRMPQGVREDIQMCVGGRDAEKDTCQGDSGGPIQVYRFQDRLYGIVGVTSFGKACGVANIPAVYSKVSYYVSWIESVVWP